MSWSSHAGTASVYPRATATERQGGTHMFGVMDLGTRIAVFVTIAAVVGLAVVAVRWIGAQRR